MTNGHSSCTPIAERVPQADRAAGQAGEVDAAYLAKTLIVKVCATDRRDAAGDSAGFGPLRLFRPRAKP